MSWRLLAISSEGRESVRFGRMSASVRVGCAATGDADAVSVEVEAEVEFASAQADIHTTTPSNTAYRAARVERTTRAAFMHEFTHDARAWIDDAFMMSPPSSGRHASHDARDYLEP